MCHCNAARGWRAHAADNRVAVVATDGSAADRFVVGQVAQLGQAGSDGNGGGHAAGADLDLVHNALRNRSGVKRIGTALRQTGQRGGVIRIFDGGTQRPGAEVGVQKIGSGLRVAQQIVAGAADGRGHAATDGKAVGGQFDRRLEQVGPGLAAMVLVRQLQHAHCAGGADGPTAGLGAQKRLTQVRQRVGLVGGADVAQVVLRSRSRGGFTPVIALHGIGGGLVVQHEGTTAQAGRLRLHQPQHGLHGYGSINRRAARRQNIAARLGGQRVGRDHHVGIGLHRCFAGLVARLGLWNSRVAGQARAHHHTAAGS